MNAPPNLRTTPRLITHCDPSAMDDYEVVSNYSNDISYMRYYYGNYGKEPGFTYEYQELSIAQKLSEGVGAAMGDYTLG